MAIEPKKVSNLDAATIQALRELGLGYITVSELPELIDEGAILLYNGTLWKGLSITESSLPAGTPWPVKGYKELVCSILHSSNNEPTLIIHKSDFNSVLLEYDSIGNQYGVKTNEIVTYELSMNARFSGEHFRTHSPQMYYAEEAGIYVYPDIEIVTFETVSPEASLGIEMRIFQSDANLKATTNSVALDYINIGGPFYLPKLYYYPPPPVQ